MAKILISTLGTGHYDKTKYDFSEITHDSRHVYETRYIQEATIRALCAGWNPATDKIKILVTKDAINKNWIESTNTRKEPDTPLKEILENLSQEPPYALCKDIENIPVQIPEGKTQEQIWEIFNAIIKHVNNGDEVYFDITHSFRSIPMLVTVSIPYLRTVRKIKMKSITYGAWEARNAEKNLTPVFNLSDFISLMNWSDAARDFAEYGQSDSIVKLLMEDLHPFLVSSELRTPEVMVNKEIAKWINTLTTAILKNDIDTIISYNEKFQSNLETYEAIMPEKFSAFVPLVDTIKQKTAEFQSGSLNNIFHAVKLCIEHKMFQNAYSILFEGCITIALKQIGIDPQNEDNRSCFMGACHHLCKPKPSEEIKGDKSIIKKIGELLTTKDADKFLQLNNYRNSYMHCGTGNNPLQNDVLEKIQFFLNSARDWYERLPNNTIPS